MPFIDAVSFAESNNPDTSYEGRSVRAAAGEYIASRTNIALGSSAMAHALELVKHSI